VGTDRLGGRPDAIAEAALAAGGAIDRHVEEEGPPERVV
jgi:hypothetical protein